MSTGLRIFANTFSQYAMRAIGVLLAFVLVPFLVRKLGVETYGLLVLFESFSLMAESALVGWRSALSRHATIALSQRRERDFAQYLSAGRLIFVSAAVAVCCGGALLAWIAPSVFRIPAGYETQVQALCVLFALASASSLVNSVYWAGLYAKERFDQINFAASAALVLRAALILLLFSALSDPWKTLTLYGVIHLVSTLIQNFAVKRLFRRLLPGVRIARSRFERGKLDETLSFGAYAFIANGATAAHDNLLALFVNFIWGPFANALYAVGTKFPDFFYSVFKEPAWALTPTVTSLVAREERTKLKDLLYLFTKGMTLLSVPICLVLGWMAPVILSSWAGAGFETVWPVMTLGLVSLAVSVPFALCEVFPNAYGKMKLPALMCVLGVTASLAVSFHLALSMDLGLNGIALGTSAVTVLYTAGFSAPYACRLSGFSLARYVFEAFLKPGLFAGVVWGAWIWGLYAAAVAPLSVATLALGAAFVPLYAWAAFRLTLGGAERKRLLRLARDLVDRAKPRRRSAAC